MPLLEALQKQQAVEAYADLLEYEADRRARRGTREPVFYKGVQVGAVRKYSDTLLMFRLKALRPAKYRERYEHEHKGALELVHKLQRLP